MTPDNAALADHTSMPTERAFLPLHAWPEVVRHARRFVAAAVVGFPYDPYDIALIASELTTNAVRTAMAMRTWPDDMFPIGVEVTVTERYAHVAVTDPNPGPMPASARGGLLAQGGRGLVIVDQHALARWATYADDGKTVHVVVMASGVLLTDDELKRIGVPQ
ncbi:ATP-binding protein [Actinoallomurus sp. CA-150999]|uniref:ATP-binding protein n=1 Tax=Actinoallomurus sp. CA-150999 TaxID=3239887 RepID=UPI003D8A7D48